MAEAASAGDSVDNARGSASNGGSGSDAGYAITADGDSLILQAFDGDSGAVAAQVAIIEPGAGQVETCTGPLDAGACQLSCQLEGIGDPSSGYANFGPLSASVGTTTVSLTYNG